MKPPFLNLNFYKIKVNNYSKITKIKYCFLSLLILYNCTLLKNLQ